MRTDERHLYVEQRPEASVRGEHGPHVLASVPEIDGMNGREVGHTKDHP
jgi:hypothetical protein